MTTGKRGLRIIVLTSALGCALALANQGAIAQQSSRAHAAPIEGKMLVQVIGEVRAVDSNARRVTLVDVQGHATQLNVGQDVKDLDKLPLGTRIKSTALQPVTLMPVQSAKPQPMIPGDKQFIARVASVDATAGVVMLKDANDLPIEVRTRDPNAAAMLSQGMTVQVRLANKATRSGPAQD
jgi:hypothetical protein